MPEKGKRANAVRYLEYGKMVKIERRLRRKMLEDPGPKSPAPPPSSGGAPYSTSEVTAENRLARGQKSFELSNSMTWSDQNCPTKGVYFAMIFLLKTCVKLCDIFINSYFIYFGFNTSYITIMRYYCSV